MHKKDKFAISACVLIYLEKINGFLPQGNLQNFFITKVWQTLYKFEDYYLGYHCMKFCYDLNFYKGRVSENVLGKPLDDVITEGTP